MTILEAIQRSAEFLAKRGVESPRLQVELLLAHLLKMPRMKLYLNFGRELQPAEMDALRALVQRRGAREPLQYIVGSVSFDGLEIRVNRNVLIPRPETELLAARAVRFLEGCAAGGTEPRALDLCTGSGCLALTMAAKVPAARVWATDISPGALEVARDNAAQLGLAARVEFREGDLLAAAEGQAKFNLIVSNPPYIRRAELAALEPELREHEPMSALDGGEDGQDFYRRIAAEAGAFLAAGGRVMVELEEEGAEATRALFAGAGWVVEAVETDENGKPRILIARAAE